MYTEIEYEAHDHVGIITIDRPEARNALTFTTYDELADAVTNTTARCLVITGRDPAFCSGDDVKQVMVAASSELSSRDRTRASHRPPARCCVPTCRSSLRSTAQQSVGAWSSR